MKYYREKSIFSNPDGPLDTEHIELIETMFGDLGLSLYIVFNPETAPQEVFGDAFVIYQNRRDKDIGYYKNGGTYNESFHYIKVASALSTKFKYGIDDEALYNEYKNDPDTVKLTALKRYWDAAILVLQQSRRFLEPAMKYVDKKMWFEAEIYVKKLHASDFADLILKMKTFEEMKDILFEAEDYAFATMKNK